MTYRELPIISAPAQTFDVVLAGRRCDFNVVYSETTNRWSFDLAIDGVPVLTGRRIVAGVDLLAPFELGIGKLIAVPWGDPAIEPGRTELPAGRVRLIHYEADAA